MHNFTGFLEFHHLFGYLWRVNEEAINKDDLLKPEIMIRLYSRGLFPMADETGSIDWYMPEIRTILPLDSFNIPRSLRKFIEKSDFEFRYDQNIMKVIDECANRDETWISDQLRTAYKGLLDMGYLHSVEVYEKNQLVGGLYGVSYKGAFFGESMFSKVSQSSKCALAKLLEHLSDRGYALLDVQYPTDHLNMFGAKEISLDEYMDLLEESYNKDAAFI